MHSVRECLVHTCESDVGKNKHLVELGAGSQYAQTSHHIKVKGTNLMSLMVHHNIEAHSLYCVGREIMLMEIQLAFLLSWTLGCPNLIREGKTNRKVTPPT